MNCGSILRAVAVVALTACGPRKSTTPPAPTTGGATKTDPVTGATAFAYGSAKLRSQARMDVTSTGGGVYVQATGTLFADLTLDATGEGMTIAWDITKVEGLEVDGTLPDNGEDLPAYLAEHGRGAWVTDPTGLENAAATDAHPGNAARLEELARASKRLAQARAQGEPATPEAPATLLEQLPPLLALPVLPQGPLAPGDTDERAWTTEVEVAEFGVVLSIDAVRRVSLVVIDTSGTTKLAELQITEERYGGLVTDEGDIDFEEKVEGTLLFDLDRGIPFRLEQTTTSSFTAGEQGGDTTRTVRADFEPIE